MKKIALIALLAISCIAAQAQEVYKATVFGAKSDGITDNTASIQRAVDFISEKGGGTLIFYVGRYVTGNIVMKSNVTLMLAEAAVLVATPNIYGYKGNGALITAAEGSENVKVCGYVTKDGTVRAGVIEGGSTGIKQSIAEQQAKGYIGNIEVPAVIDLSGCSNGKVENIKIYDPAGALIKGAEASGITVYSGDYLTTPEGKTIKIKK